MIKKINKFMVKHSWMILTISYLLLSVIGFIGFGEYKNLEEGDVLTIWDKIYMTLQLITMESGGYSGDIKSTIGIPIPLKLQIARFLIPLVTILAFVHLAFIIARDKFTEFWIRLFYRNHTIICGIGHQGRQLALGELGNGNKVVIIELDEKNQYIDELREAGAKIINGDATDKDVLLDAGLNKASSLVAAVANDVFNIRIVHNVKELRKGRTNKFNCYIHLLSMNVRTLLDQEELSQNGSFSLYYFNVFEQNARALFRDIFSTEIEDEQNNILPRTIKCPEDAPPHFVIFGLTDIGEQLVRQIALLGYFASNQPTILTVVEDEDEKLKALGTIFEKINKEQAMIDYRSKLVSYDAMTSADLNNIFSPQPDLIYVCLETEEGSLLLANRLRVHSIEPKIIIGCENMAGLAEEFGETLNKRGIITFRKSEKIRSLLKEKDPDELAETIFADYHDPGGEHTESHKQWWIESSMEEKESNRLSADHLLIKLWTFGKTPQQVDSTEYNSSFSPDDEEILQKMEHRRWSANKYLNGYGLDPGYGAKQNMLLKKFESLEGDEKNGNVKMVKNIKKLCGKAVEVSKRNY